MIKLKTMTKQVIKNILIVAIISFNYGVFAQQEEKETTKTEFSFEIDPATFGFGGYGFHLRIKPKNSEHLFIGFGAYAMDMPDVFVDINKDNKNKGWDVRLNQGYGLFAEHHFTKVNKKWFAGGQLGLQEYKIENEAIQGSEKFTNILFMTYGGYTWQPFDFNFYIKPWAGIGYNTKTSGSNTLGNLEYDISPILIFATLHIGYTF